MFKDQLEGLVIISWADTHQEENVWVTYFAEANIKRFKTNKNEKYHKLVNSFSRISLSTSFLLSVFSLTVTLVRFHNLLVIMVDLPIK